MRLSPDEMIFWEQSGFQLNATIVFTWVVMLILVVGSRLITSRLSAGLQRSRWQNALELIVTTIVDQIEDIGIESGRKYIGFLGTIFLFIATSSLLSVVPGFQVPTASLSTTTALALCVFIAIPLFGMEDRGVLGYLKTYAQPSFIMLPFNLIGEASRTVALAIRLFGNMMSGGLIVAILLVITPFIFPIIMTALGLLTGMVQAYIFFILATVYIAAAIRSAKPKPTKTIETQ